MISGFGTARLSLFIFINLRYCRWIVQNKFPILFCNVSFVPHAVDATSRAAHSFCLPTHKKFGRGFVLKCKFV